MSNEPSTEPATQIDQSKPKFAAYGLVAALAAVIGFAAVYGIAGRSDNAANTSLQDNSASGAAAIARPATPGPGASLANEAQNPSPDRSSPAQSSSQTSLSGINPLSTGKMITFVFKKTPVALPEISFTDGAGKTKTLKDWRGKVVLLNLWATWCAPCRREMPELDALQGELGSDKFEVVALSVDRKGLAASKRFLDQIKVKHLRLYNDVTTAVAARLKAIGMPTTLLIDAKGREIGRLIGPAEWHSPDAIALIKAHL